ncbi:MAG: metallophosphoesterase [Syntrophomonadaceae bacterium]
MLIAAVADTHGQTDLIISRLDLVQPDYLLFAGDFYRDGRTIARKLKIEATIVAGNCDSSYRDRQEQVVSLQNRRFLLIHGHQYGVKNTLNRLYYYARELEVDAVVFGHTHSPFCERVGDIWMINPGSPVRPRLSGQGSYALIVVDQENIRPVIKRMGG